MLDYIQSNSVPVKSIWHRRNSASVEFNTGNTRTDFDFSLKFVYVNVIKGLLL